MNYESNLLALHDDIVSRTYRIQKSICFINFKPVQREIFAAEFRDRVVHHLIYNYIAPIFEKRFIYDSYSCRKGKGTHFGINRIKKFIRSCSKNYTTDCYILKLDIKGYFMAMNRHILYKKLIDELEKQKGNLPFEYDLIIYLIHIVIFNDPTQDCNLKGKHSDWKNLPFTKSLFHAEKDCGLPIGNLTSQLFGNIYGRV
jgi:RNA-directed DNA polymerase